MSADAHPDLQALAPMKCIVIGVGYLGSRVLSQLEPGAAKGLSRSAVTVPVDQETSIINLDEPVVDPLPLPAEYAVLYTVAPSEGPAPDARLTHLLAKLDPLPKRFVYISTSGVYGDCGGEMVDESAKPDPSNARGERRLANERMLQQWCSKNHVTLVVLRVPGIYGPGRLGVERIQTGAAILREQDANPGNRIHVDDLVACCIAAIKTDTPSGTYNVGDGDFRSSTWFATEVARMAGFPPPPQISRKDAEQQFSAARLSFLADARRLDTRKMREELNVKPRYANAGDGIRASLEADALLVHH